MDEDKIIRLYTRLSGLKQNLPKGTTIHERYIKDYHDILDLLAKETNSKLEEFSIPQEEIKHRITSSWPTISTIGQKGGRTYSEDKYCEGALFLGKLDALLSYFTIKYLSKNQDESGNGGAPVGFTPPNK